MLALVPNVITVVRIVLVLPTAWLLWEARYVEALILTAVAGASDAVDGCDRHTQAARRRSSPSWKPPARTASAARAWRVTFMN